jgi:hypothetical protein
MKRDILENYIVENREGMDNRIPPEGLWERISGGIRKDSTTNYLRYWQAAAVVFFAITIGLLVNNFQKVGEMDASTIASEFSVTEDYYFQVIKDKESILTAYLKQYPDLADDFKNDLVDLEKNYRTLKKEFNDTGSPEVLNALIKNLQLQQELLNNQLQVIQLIQKENENVSI